MTVFSDNLKYYRKVCNLSRPDFAEKLNVALSTYGAYEQGRREPNLETLSLMADILGISVDTLLGHQVDNYDYYATLLSRISNYTHIQFSLTVSHEKDEWIFGKGVSLTCHLSATHAISSDVWSFKNSITLHFKTRKEFCSFMHDQLQFLLTTDTEILLPVAEYLESVFIRHYQAEQTKNRNNGADVSHLQEMVSTLDTIAKESGLTIAELIEQVQKKGADSQKEGKEKSSTETNQQSD